MVTPSYAAGISRELMSFKYYCQTSLMTFLGLVAGDDSHVQSLWLKSCRPSRMNGYHISGLPRAILEAFSLTMRRGVLNLMNTKRIFIIFAVSAVILTAGSAAYAVLDFSHQKTPVMFYQGHTHDDGDTHGAPGHSGGTDRWGCHNGSVPYHCH